MSGELKWYMCPRCGQRCDWTEGDNSFCCPRCELNVDDAPDAMRRWVERLTRKLGELVTLMATSAPVEREAEVLEFAVRLLLNRLWEIRDAQAAGSPVLEDSE